MGPEPEIYNFKKDLENFINGLGLSYEKSYSGL